MSKLVLRVPASSFQKAIKRKNALTPKVTTPKQREQSPWKAHRDYEEKFIGVVSDRLLALFLEIRRKWLKLPGEFRKAVDAEVFNLNGRIFINPKTGRPLTKKQWDEVVKTLDSALTKIFKDSPNILVERALMLGKILQGMDYEARKKTSFDDIPKLPPIPRYPEWENALVFGERMTAEYIVDLKSRSRKKIATTILDAIKNKNSVKQLEQKLFDNFADLNRDWRMIAETEIVMNLNAGLLLSEERHGDEPIYMIGVTAPGACPDCERLIKNKVVILSENPNPSGKMRVKGEEYDVIWVGKNNIGRKASALWTCIPLHPHCRCSWTRYYPEMKGLLGLQKARKEEKKVEISKIFTGEGANKPDSDFDEKELTIGAFIESEHTDDIDVAKRIAKDHLMERSDYYKQPLFKEERKEAIDQIISRG